MKAVTKPVKRSSKLEKAAASCKKLSDLWRTCEVTEVRSPGSSTKTKNSPAKKPNESPKKTTPSKIRYEVSEKDADIEVLHVVSPDCISRTKGSLSKDKTKLFLKQSVEAQNGVLKVKNSFTQKYKLNSVVSPHSPTKKVRSEKTLKSTTTTKLPKTAKPNTSNKGSPVKSALKNSQSPSKIKKTLKSIDADIRKMFPKNSQKVSQQSKENNPLSSLQSKVMAEKKAATKEAKEEARKQKILDRREKKKAEAKLLNEYLGDWKKRREDLECDDLQDLPAPTAINCGIPRDSFGEAVAIMEFLHQFSNVLQVKNTFPSGFKIGLMEKALTDMYIQGPFSDLLQLLLLAVFKQQDLEEEEPHESSKGSKDDDISVKKDMTRAAAVTAANIAIKWSTNNLGCLIRQFPLDPFTLTELLRLHLLSSGAEISTIVSNRGNFKNVEDPGLSFKISNPGLLKKLSTTSVFLFSPEERLEILKVLMEQLLTYPTFRDILRKNVKDVKNSRIQLLKIYRNRRKLIKGTKQDNNEKDPEVILMSTENGDLPGPLETKETRVMTEEEKAELEQIDGKIKDTRNTIDRLRGLFRTEPIGIDRAHRNFWLFNSVDGLFVEDRNPFAGMCQPKPTPTQITINGIMSQEELPLSLMHKCFSIMNNSNEKENNLLKANGQNKNASGKKLLTTLNGVTSTQPEVKDDKEGDKKAGKVVFGMCTANPATCLVHGPNPDRLSWGFYHKEKDLQSLLNGLNPRGFREFCLKRDLKQEKVAVKESMEKCPVSILNILMANEEEDLVEQRKSSRIHADKMRFVGIHPEEALETTLRDSILDNENKIWSGGLGSLKVKSREAWRTAIENNSYDPQCDLDLDFLLELPQPLKLSCDEEASTSRSPSPPACLTPNIQDLAKAMIQVALCVQSKYLGAPLAPNEISKRLLEKLAARIKKKKQEEDNEAPARSSKRQQEKLAAKIEKKDQEEDNEGDMELKKSGEKPSPMEKWLRSVLVCTSLSQLFLHLITLENSISWHRSALKANCKICRKCSDGENMLLCDKCDRGFHIYCLKPALKSVPEGEWFCIACTPPEERTRSERTHRRTLKYKEISSDEDENDSDEDSEGDEDSSDESDVDEPKTRSSRSTRRSANVNHNSNKCMVCRKGGSLVCCDGCTESTHLMCAKPPLFKVPRGQWFCHRCQKEGDNDPSFKIQGSDVTARITRNGKRKSSNCDSSGPSNHSRRSSQNALLDVSACEEVLDTLLKHQDSWPFAGKTKKADYRHIVKRPVDLNSIHLKLKNKNYHTNNQFVADVYLMLQNCEVFHSNKSDEHEASKRLSRYFQTLLRKYKFEDANEVIDLASKRPRRAY